MTKLSICRTCWLTLYWFDFISCSSILNTSLLYFWSFLLCRSSSNSLGRRSYGFGGAPLVGGSLRVHSTRSPHSYTYAAEQESLLSHPSHSHHPLPPHHPPPPPLLLSRHFAARRDRRALSLELPELLRAGGQPPGQLPVHPDPGRRSGSGAGGSITGGSGAGSGLGVDHRDCNGKTPGPHTQLMAEVFPQVNARKDRADLDEETDYVSRRNYSIKKKFHKCMIITSSEDMVVLC